MHRLPIPGGDNNAWGDILNDFLAQAHNTDGSLKDGAIDTAQLADGSVTAGKLSAANPSAGQVLGYDGSNLGWSTPSGSGSVPDATVSTKGLVQLSGDLGGTAGSPTVPGLAAKAADNSVVHLAGSETVTGAKNFTGGLTISGTAVVAANDFRLSDQRVPVDGTVTNAKLDSSTQAAISKANSSVQASQVAAANGVASLDGSTKVPVGQIPDLSAVYVPKQTGTAGLVYGIKSDGTTGLISNPAEDAQTSGPPYQRGVNLSGLEFAPGVVPGTNNVTYYAPASGDYSYFKGKGFGVVRLPFLWERLQPYLNGGLDPAYKGLLDSALATAASNGMKVVLDCHNYARRFVPYPGGFTNDFSSSAGTFSGGTIVGGQYVSDQNTYFTSFTCGDLRNPVSPAAGYVFQADVTITDQLTGTGNYPNLWVRAMDNGSGTYYQLSISGNEQKFKWSKSVNGTSTAIGEVAATISLNTVYTTKIDINQGSAGNVVITVNGSQIASFPTDGAITNGRISFNTSFTKCAVDNASLNVAGDTTGANSSGTYRVGDPQIPVSALADLWSKLAAAYANNPTVYMYDIMNEPHDMPVPTTSSNYNSTATVTVMNQAVINAIRAADTETWIALEMDAWAGMQSFTTSYGSNPTPWWTDTSGKTMISAHYYFDTDHSGSYQTAWSSTLRTRISGEVTPLLSWAQTNGIPVFVGEYGVPKGTSSDAQNWQTDMDSFLGILDTYGAHATYWAAGSHYTASTTIEPTTGGSVDYNTQTEQMPYLVNHLGQQVTPLPASEGGTGLVSPGATGNVLTSTGTGWTSSTPASGGASLETTNLPVADAATAVLGTAATAARSDHVHPFGVHDHSDATHGGATLNPGNILQYVLSGQMTASRIETLPRFIIGSGTDTATSGTVWLSYFTAEQALAVTKLLSSTTATAMATPTLCRMGLYTVNGSNNLTCVARMTSDTTMWNATNSVFTKLIADDGQGNPISTYTTVRGQRYAMAFLFVGTTAPSLASKTLPNGSLGSLSPIMNGSITSQTDLAGSYTSGQVVGTTKWFWGGLAP